MSDRFDLSSSPGYLVNRAGRAMALFREIAQHRQVILFTCHERDCPAQA